MRRPGRLLHSTRGSTSHSILSLSSIGRFILPLCMILGLLGCWYAYSNLFIGSHDDNYVVPSSAQQLSQHVDPSSSSPPTLNMPQLILPPAVKYVYINIGTSWDPWPGCGTKGLKNEIKTGHNNEGGLPYNENVFCIYIEPLMRVNTALYDRGLITNSSILIHAAVSNTRGLAPFYEYAGVSGVASSLTTVDEKMVAQEKGGKGPYTSGARGQSWTTVITLKDVLDIIPRHVRILEMKTDMQGFDVTAIKSAGDDIVRIDEIFHECFGDGEDEVYSKVPTPNTFGEARVHLESFGFEAGNSRTHDCNWRRKGVERVPGMVYIGDFK